MRTRAWKNYNKKDLIKTNEYREIGKGRSSLTKKEIVSILEKKDLENGFIIPKQNPFEKTRKQEIHVPVQKVSFKKKKSSEKKKESNVKSIGKKSNPKNIADRVKAKSIVKKKVSNVKQSGLQQQTRTSYDFRVGEQVFAKGMNRLGEDGEFIHVPFDANEEKNQPNIVIVNQLQSVNGVQVFKVKIQNQFGLMKTSNGEMVLETVPLRWLQKYPGFPKIIYGVDADPYYTTKNKNIDFFVEDYIPYSYDEWLSKRPQDFGKIWSEMIKREDILHNQLTTSKGRSVSVFYIDWRGDNIRIQEDGTPILIDFDGAVRKLQDNPKIESWKDALFLPIAMTNNTISIDVLKNGVWTRGSDLECLMWAALISYCKLSHQDHKIPWLSWPATSDITTDAAFRKKLLQSKEALIKSSLFADIGSKWEEVKNLVMNVDFKKNPNYNKLSELFTKI